MNWQAQEKEGREAPRSISLALPCTSNFIYLDGSEEPARRCGAKTTGSSGGQIRRPRYTLPCKKSWQPQGRMEHSRQALKAMLRNVSCCRHCPAVLNYGAASRQNRKRYLLSLQIAPIVITPFASQ